MDQNCHANSGGQLQAYFGDVMIIKTGNVDTSNTATSFQRIRRIQNMRRPYIRGMGAPRLILKSHAIPGSAGLFPIQGNPKAQEPDIVQIAHIGQILHVSSLFTEFHRWDKPDYDESWNTPLWFHGLRQKLPGFFVAFSAFLFSFFFNAFAARPGQW